MIERREFLKTLMSLKDKKLIKVVTGIRRCGKSTLFELYQDMLLENGVSREQIINVNLEDGDFRHIRNAESLYEYVSCRLLKNKTNYIRVYLCLSAAAEHCTAFYKLSHKQLFSRNAGAGKEAGYPCLP